jgi:hypothetical protein
MGSYPGYAIFQVDRLLIKIPDTQNKNHDTQILEKTCIWSSIFSLFVIQRKFVQRESMRREGKKDNVLRVLLTVTNKNADFF